MTISTFLTGADAVSLRESRHKAAIALNNAAVSLLIRGFYRDAVDTLKDAIQFMKIAAVPVEEQNGAEEISAEETHLAFNRSWKRAAVCGTSTNACQDCFTNRPILQVISSQYNSTSINEAVASCTQSSTRRVCFPVAIDPIDFEGSDDDDIEFNSGVIMYNYGIAFDCLAAAVNPTTNDAYDHQKLIQAKAHRLFQITGALLFKLYQDHQDNIPTYEAGRLLLLMTLLTHNLMQASINLNMQLEYHEHCQTMESLLQLMEFYQFMLPNAGNNIATAA